MSSLPNIIFLDFDGVLVTNRACLAVGNTGGGFSYFDPVACLLVRRLCEEYNAKIVISSAWRQMYDKDAIDAILSANCPNLGRHIWSNSVWWKTPEWIYEEEPSETSDRGREIKQWIDRHETEFNNFVILDDMSNMRPVQDSLVKCDVYDGLGWHQYRAAAKMLEGDGWDD